MHRESPAAGNVPLTERAYQALRKAIVSCDLQPGMRLKVETLSRELGFSSSPLREALSRLAQEGFIQALDHRGFRVTPISLDELRDLTRLRVLLETEALAESIDRGGDEWEARIVAAFHRLALFEQRLDGGPVALNDDWSGCHRDFHFALMSGCESPLMLRVAGTLFDQAERYRRFSARHRMRSRSQKSEHQALMDAALARKKSQAIALLREHITTTAENVTAALTKVELPTIQ
jgi:GntR family transcriptional regulator, carbon starvation induced regulator